MPSCYDFTSFQNYTIGFGARHELRRLTAAYGDRYLVVHDHHLTDELKQEISQSITSPTDAFQMQAANPLGRSAGLMDTLERTEPPIGSCAFYQVPRGACTYAAIEQVGREIVRRAPEIIVVVGGAKCMDLARAAAHYQGRDRAKIALLPTVVASNATANGMSVIYSDDGTQMVDFWNLEVMPECLIVDTELIARTPARTLAAAIGDQVASSVEAIHTLEATGFIADCDPFAVAHHRDVLDVLNRYGIAAVRALERGEVTHELEWVLHAVTRYTGPELAVATSYFSHILDEALLALPGVPQRMHGEIVGYGVLPEFVCVGEPDRLYGWVDMYRAIGLPTTLQELSGTTCTYEDVLRCCEQASDKIMASRAMTPQDPERMARAVMESDQLVRRYLDLPA